MRLGKPQPRGSYTYGPPKGPFKKPRIMWQRRSVLWQHFRYRHSATYRRRLDAEEAAWTRTGE